MKRDGREFDSEVPPKKMQKGDTSNISVRFLIPARAAGLIIGKGGENIKRIRTQFSVRLNIPDTRGIERVFTVEGALGDICNVWRDIMPKLKDVMNAKLSDPKVIMGHQRFPRRRQQRNQGGEGDQQESEEIEEDEKMVDLRILVHQSIAGCIIGKGGERIRELRQKYQMRVIKVYQMLAPCSTDRVVQLIAEPENAVQCMEAIVEVAENTTIRGPTELYDASNCSEADALTYGGWLSPERLQALSQGMPIGGGGSVTTPAPVMGPGGGGNRYGGGPPRGAIPPPHPPPPPPPAMYLGRQQPIQQQQLPQRGFGGPQMYQQPPPPPPSQFPPRGLPPRQQHQWGYPDGFGEAGVGSGYPGYPQQQSQQQQAPPMPVAPPVQQSSVVGVGGVGVGGYDNAGLYVQPPHSTGYNVPPPQVTAGAPPSAAAAAAAAMYRMNAPLNNPAAAAAAAAAVAAAAAAATGGGGVGGAPIYGGLAPPPNIPGGGPPQPPAPVPQPPPYGYAIGAGAPGLPGQNVAPPTAAAPAGYPPGAVW